MIRLPMYNHSRYSNNYTPGPKTPNLGGMMVGSVAVCAMCSVWSFARRQKNPWQTYLTLGVLGAGISVGQHLARNAVKAACR